METKKIEEYLDSSRSFKQSFWQLDRSVFIAIFRRLNGRWEYPGVGIGVGLAICKKIAERHGGHVGLEPDEGGGTTFNLATQSDPKRVDAL